LSDVLILLAVFLLIYLVECLSWIPANRFVFRTTWVRDFAPARSMFPIERFGYRLYLGNLIPGLGDLAVCEPLDPLLSDGVGKDPEELRQRFLRMLDTQRVRRRLRQCQRIVRPSYTNSWLLLALLFGVFPILAWRLGLTISLLLLPVLLIVLVHNVWSFHRLHRLLEPQAFAERREKTVALALSPLGVIRASSLLLKESIASFHPLAVSAATMPRVEARHFAARVLRELRFSLDGENVTSEGQAAQSQWRTVVWEWTKKEFGDPETLLGAPEKRSESSVAYCPRCEQEYVVAEGECADCRGIRLRAFVMAGPTASNHRS